MHKDEIFVPDNAIWEDMEVARSPLGTYSLRILPFFVGEGYSNHVKGVVYLTETYRPLAIVYRNYSLWWHRFIENYSDGHDYLLCGEDYQGQTVIQLDTGKRVDYVPEEAANGIGFCWIDAADHGDNELRVEGCYWGAPFETVIYDFAKPMELPYKELDRWESYA